MKPIDIVIWGLVILAVIMTGMGGWLNMTSNDSINVRLTSQHSWNDGLFIMLLAILLAVLYH
jgi:hypothetical protein